MQFTNIKAKISEFFNSKSGKLLLTWLQRFITLGVIIWLGLELSKVGWGNVWKSLPTQPLFYLIFILFFFQLPIMEAIVYKITWPISVFKSIPAFLQKRVYNKEVFGYSGEVFLLFWAKSVVGLKGKEAFKTIKDNNIISSVASTIFSVVLLSIFIFTDQIKVLDWLFEKSAVYYSIAAITFIVVSILIYRFRRVIISMNLNNALKVFTLLSFRLLLVQILNLLMYYVVLPDVPLYTWFIYIALEIVISRIPFLPNRDVIYTSMSISIASTMIVSQEEIAGIMLAKLALNKVGSLISFLYAKWASKNNPPIIEEPSEITS
tara:strand:+ start:3981 stop:4940 length:960 start_codon:yes stop_codon:yes gene_type:complete